jgi:hypothetical protein
MCNSHLQRMLGHRSAALRLDACAGLFDEDLDAASARMDDLIAEESG